MNIGITVDYDTKRLTIDDRVDVTGRVWAAQYTEEANCHDMRALMKIVMYLWHTKDLGLRLRSMEVIM